MWKFLHLLPHAYPLFAGETPLDMSAYRCLSMDWRNSEKLASYVLVQSKVLVMTDSLCFIPLPPHTHIHTIWYECLSPHSPPLTHPPPHQPPIPHPHPPTPTPTTTPHPFFLLPSLCYFSLYWSRFVCLSVLCPVCMPCLCPVFSLCSVLSVCLVSCLHALSLSCLLSLFCMSCVLSACLVSVLSSLSVLCVLCPVCMPCRLGQGILQ